MRTSSTSTASAPSRAASWVSPSPGGASPPRGVQISLGLSLLFAAGVAVYSVLKMQRPELWYPPLDPLINLIFFGFTSVISNSLFNFGKT